MVIKSETLLHQCSVKRNNNIIIMQSCTQYYHVRHHHNTITERPYTAIVVDGGGIGNNVWRGWTWAWVRVCAGGCGWKTVECGLGGGVARVVWKTLMRVFLSPPGRRRWLGWQTRQIHTPHNGYKIRHHTDRIAVDSIW